MKFNAYQLQLIADCLNKAAQACLYRDLHVYTPNPTDLATEKLCDFCRLSAGKCPMDGSGDCGANGDEAMEKSLAALGFKADSSLIDFSFMGPDGWTRSQVVCLDSFDSAEAAIISLVSQLPTIARQLEVKALRERIKFLESEVG